MTPAQKAGRKTGPKPQVSSTDIVHAALARGLDRFSITELAGDLGVVPSALYRYFSSREAIVHDAMALAARQINIPESITSWQDILRESANQIWNLCEKYPGMAAAIYQNPGAPIHVMHIVLTTINQLVDAGIPGGRKGAEFALDFAGDTVLSTHIWIEHMRQVDEETLRGYDQACREYREASYSELSIFNPDSHWSEYDLVDQKIEFVIVGLPAFAEQHLN